LDEQPFVEFSPEIKPKAELAEVLNYARNFSGIEHDCAALLNHGGPPRLVPRPVTSLSSEHEISSAPEQVSEALLVDV
jgi:hypothetical protein